MKKSKNVAVFLLMLGCNISPTFIYFEPETRNELIRQPLYWVISILMAIGVTNFYNRMVDSSN